MRITVHITFYVKNNLKEKLKKLSKIYNSFFTLSKNTHIYIHTNKKIKNYKKNLFFIYHNIVNQDPFKLSWKYRSIMEKQKNDYDYFIYSEDDILFNLTNFKYWLKYKKFIENNNFNIGFLRTEKSDLDNTLWSPDQFEKSNEYIILNKKKFLVLKNPYCAMWIYDKAEFSNFIKSKFWDLRKWRGVNSFTRLYDREKAAIGWNGLNMRRYNATVIPLVNDKIIDSCLINHTSNKYVKERGRIHLEIQNLMEKPLKKFILKKISRFELFFKELKFIILWNFRFNFKNIKIKLKKFLF